MKVSSEQVSQQRRTRGMKQDNTDHEAQGIGSN
jgi:hypothetical protein